MKNLAVQLAERPTNSFPLLAKIRAGASRFFPTIGFPLPFPLAREIHANNEGSKRGEK